MNRKHFLRLAAAAALAATCGTSMADEKTTPAEAEAMVGKAVAAIKAQGAEKTFEQINGGKEFKDRDLYIFVYDMQGKCLAHGMNAKLVGKNLIAMKDPDGKPLIKMVVDIAGTKGKGWTEQVRFAHPISGKLRTRVNYVERVGDAIVGSGVFTD